jgi:hypothetical protein
MYNDQLVDEGVINLWTVLFSLFAFALLSPTAGRTRELCSFPQDWTPDSLMKKVTRMTGVCAARVLESC